MVLAEFWIFFFFFLFCPCYSTLLHLIPLYRRMLGSNLGLLRLRYWHAVRCSNHSARSRPHWRVTEEDKTRCYKYKFEKYQCKHRKYLVFSNLPKLILWDAPFWKKQKNRKNPEYLVHLLSSLQSWKFVHPSVSCLWGHRSKDFVLSQLSRNRCSWLPQSTYDGQSSLWFGFRRHCLVS